MFLCHGGKVSENIIENKKELGSIALWRGCLVGA